MITFHHHAYLLKDLSLLLDQLYQFLLRSGEQNGQNQFHRTMEGVLPSIFGLIIPDLGCSFDDLKFVMKLLIQKIMNFDGDVLCAKNQILSDVSEFSKKILDSSITMF